MALPDDLAAKMNADDPEETSKVEKEAVDKDVVREVLYEHRDIEPPHIESQRNLAARTHGQIIETTRWAFAINDVYDISTRRKAAQKLVAEHTEPQHGESDSLSLQAVQDKVRKLFDGRYGRRTAQDHFDDVLEDLEEAYDARMENR